jgi:hypothetical protein
MRGSEKGSEGKMKLQCFNLAMENVLKGLPDKIRDQLSRYLLSISAHRHLIDNYLPCMRGVKKFDNVQINVIIIYSGAVWLKLCTVD